MQPHGWTKIVKLGEGSQTGKRNMVGNLNGKQTLRPREWIYCYRGKGWRRKWQPTPVFLPGEPQGRQSLVGCRLRGRGRTESDTTEATGQRQGEVWGRGKKGVWDGHAHAAVFRMDNHAGPPAERRERRSVLCNNPVGKEIWKRIDIGVWITESLCDTPENNTMLLINSTPLWNFKS